MQPSHTLEQRYAAIRAEALRGADVATFSAYEALWRDARAAGDQALARKVLRDLSRLTAELDPGIARALASASAPDAPLKGAAADRGATERTACEVSVVVLGVPERAGDSPALRSLARQTLAAGRFETIAVDGGDAAACALALNAARGWVIVFIAHDVNLHPDALRRHLEAARPGAAPCALLGAIEWEGLALRPLSYALDSLGLLGSQAGVEAAGDVPAECVQLDHVSFPREALLAAGGIHAGLAAFAGPELGVRLGAAGWRIALDPSIAATRTPAVDLDGWLARCRAMGADWKELRRLHGGGAPPSWLAGIGLDETEREPLFARVLAGADRQERCVEALRDSLQEIEQAAARAPEKAPALLEKLRPDLTATLLDVTQHELIRGFVHAMAGGERQTLERCAVATRRGAGVIVLSSDASAQAVAVALTELPPWAELVVGVQEGAPDRALPDDRRIHRLALPRSASAAVLKQALLSRCGADFFVLLDGTIVPTRREWEAMRLTLATLPAVGACNVDDRQEGRLAQAQLCQQLPSALVAVRRDVIEGDGGEAGPLLERLVRRGYRLATATAARETPACAR